MRQVTRKSLVSVAAAGGVLALASGTAYADSGAQSVAEGSPGVLSGNNVQVPVNVQVNICGNTVSVIGLLNPAVGNFCANVSDSSHKGGHGEHRAAQDGSDSSATQTRSGGGNESGSGGAGAQGVAKGSPGVLSGNNVQVPVDVPINACGNSVNVVGALNPAIGNECVNDSTPEKPAPEKPEHPEKPEAPEKPAPEKPEAPEKETPERVVEPQTEQSQPELAQTGAPALGAAAPVAVAMMLGGYVLFRRGRVAQR
ncbi:DUF320 domain-containing protein [Streptomyces sp. P38-E01]|uniref:DUF320 domain-containing protein n=1 Tax=Streptomyces tardus TaxID=2780544 RepID=A0A949JGS3_9ACTN|nr:chaplin family protein [Streptomyces tardus]MBU7599843.1 DUF320 domain-containing protein [Streptomyces tardus]